MRDLEILTLEQLGMHSAKFGSGDRRRVSLTETNAMPAQAVEPALYRNKLQQCHQIMAERTLDLHFWYSSDAVAGSDLFVARGRKTGSRDRTDGKYASF